MKKLTIIILLFFFCNSLYSQSLSPERITKIKSSTVRITIDSSENMGTGFFVNEDGLILTCWHVAINAVKNSKINKIFVELKSGEILEYGIDSRMEKFALKANLYDFCLLLPINKTLRKFPFLILGDYESVPEGQEVYTCGYPLAMKTQFVSKGIISTKYVDTIYLKSDRNKNASRHQALLDLTLNKGNSGGAIIALGDNASEDRVIGIADFIITPIGNIGDSLISIFKPGLGQITLSGIDPNEVYILFTKFLQSTSVGISGCVSVNHVLETLNSKD